MINKNNYESWFLDYYEGTLPAERVADLFLFLEQHPDLKEEFDAFENIKLTDDLTDVFPAKDFLKKTVVDQSNVQQFLIAELEGDLSADELKALHDFIAANKQFEADKLLYTKTKLADEAEVFPDKELLKKISQEVINTQQLLIAELEGDINPSEQKQLDKIVATHPEFERDRTLYSKTKLTADVSIKYPNKGELKKTVSLFGNRSLIYTISIAASILLFLGLYFYANQEINPNGNGAVAVVGDKDSSVKDNGSNIQNPNDTVTQKQVVPAENVKTLSSKAFAQQNETKGKLPSKRSPLLRRGAGGEAKSPEQNVAQQNPQQKKEELNTNALEQNPVAENNNSSQQNVAANEPKTIIIVQQPIAANQPSLANEVSNLAADKLSQLTNSEFFDSKSKNKKLKALTWAVNKIGGSKVKMDTQYDADDQVAAVNVSGSGFSIEHTNGF
jgi:tellurite resistance protein